MIAYLRRLRSSTANRFIARLVGSTVLLNVVMLALTALALEQSRKNHDERAATASRNLTALIKRDVLSTIQKVDLGLLAVSDEAARLPRREFGNGPNFDAFVSRFSARLPEVHGLRTTDRLGNIQSSFGKSASMRINLADRPYFEALQRPDAGLVISKPLIGRVNEQPELVFARRLETANGTFDGIVFASVEIRHFTELFSALDVGRHGLVLMHDRQLDVVARFPAAPGSSPRSMREPTTPLSASLPTSGSNGSFVVDDALDGIRRVVSIKQVGDYPLYAGVGLATEDYLADWYLERHKGIAFAIVFVAATCSVSALIWNAWRRRDANLQALRIQERKFRTLIESSPDALVITDAQDVIAIVNRQAESMFGYDAAELVGQPLAMLLPDRKDGFAMTPFGASSAAGVNRIEERWAVTSDGRDFPVSISLSPIETDEGGMVAAAIRDVTERRASEERIAFLAHHDVLTGLPNRIVMQSRFEQAAAQADRSQTKLALLFLDLDNFKTINDSLGHQVGDAVLRSVAERLREGTRDIDTISRQGGDEFLLLFAELPDADTARLMVHRLTERFRTPCIVDEREITAPFSIGIALYPDDGIEFGTLQKNADIAMYQAKAAGRNIHRFFNQRMNVEAGERMHLRQGLHGALERDEFVLHYQPQISLDTGRVAGVEALIRWRHPELGLIGPDRFIPDAEMNGLIVPIGEWVLGEACRQARQWQDAGMPSMVVAVNLSAVQFARGDVEATVRRALEDTGLDPSLLELEMTESILIQDVESVLVAVQSLKRLGVKLSIDDFGTGYSSLSYLTRFAFDKLKIDRSFIAGLATDPGHDAIVRAIVQMARGLGLKTIAEGVEDAATCSRLIDFGCDEAQGFLFARPMPPDALVAFLGTVERGMLLMPIVANRFSESTFSSSKFSNSKFSDSKFAESKRSDLGRRLPAPSLRHGHAACPTPASDTQERP